MSTDSVVFVDLDDSYLLRERTGLESFFERTAAQLFGGARVSAMTLFYEFFRSREPEYRVNREVESFLEERCFDKEFILTGRIYTDMGDDTRRAFEKHCRRFEEVFMYPGVNMYGEKVIKSSRSLLKYVFGSDMVRYKVQVVQLFSNFENVVVIDNSHSVVERMEEKEFVDEVFLVDDGLKRLK